MSLLLAAAAGSETAGPALALDSLLGVRIRATETDYRGALQSRGVAQRRAMNDGGYKEVWTLSDPRFSWLALRADGSGRVTWVTAFLRDGREIPFSGLGDVSRGSVSDEQAIWFVDTPAGGYRVIARGREHRARVITLRAMSRAPSE